MSRADESLLVFVDVQGRLAEVMDGRDALFARLEQLVRGARLLGLPILWTEQLPDKLGPTAEPFRGLLDGAPRFVKSAFSCLGAPGFADALAASGRRRVLLAGIETHVCVWQTGRDLLRRGLDLSVVADAVSSRTAANREIGLARLRDEGARLVSVEMVLFELLEDAADPRFRDLLRLVK